METAGLNGREREAGTTWRLKHKERPAPTARRKVWNLMSIKVNFSDFWSKDVSHNPIFQLISKRFDLEISQHPDYLFSGPFGKDYRAYNCVRIFCTAENIRPEFREYDYAFSFDYPITNRNYRLLSYRWGDRYGYHALKKARDVDSLLANKKGFCNSIHSNPYPTARNLFFDELSRYKRVDSAGGFRPNIGYSLDEDVRSAPRGSAAPIQMNPLPRPMSPSAERTL